MKVDLPLAGMDQRLYAPLGAAARIVNMAHDQGAWRPAPGTLKVINTTDPVVAMGSLQQHNGQPWIVVETGVAGTPGVLGYIDWPTLTIIPILSDRRVVDLPTTRTQFIQNGQWLYMFSPFNAPWRWNGRRLVRVGFDAAPPPPEPMTLGATIVDHAYGVAPVSATAGTSSEFQRGVGSRPDPTVITITTWKYAVRCRYVSDLGMVSPASKIAWVEDKQVQTGFEAYPRKSSIGLQFPEPPENVAAIQYFRSIDMYNIETTEGIEVPTYLVDELSPAEGRFYVDDHPDSELGMLLDDSEAGEIPRRIRAVASWDGCFWYLSTADQRLWKSTALFVEQVPRDGWYPLGGPGSGPGVSLHPMRNALVVLKERGVFVVTRGPNGYEVSSMSEEVGASCPVVVEVPGFGLLLLSEHGPYLISGGEDAGAPVAINFLGDGLRDFWARVNTSALYVATGTLHRREREVWFMLPSAGGAIPDLGLVFHYPSGYWSERHDYPSATIQTRAMLETKDARADLLLGAGDGVYHVGRGYSNEAVVGGFAGREVSYELGPFNLGQKATIRDLEVYTLAVGKHEIEVTHTIDRRKVPQGVETAWTLDADQGAPPYEGPAIWDGTKAKWDLDETWEALVPTQLRWSLHAQKGWEHTLKFSGPDLYLVAAKAVVDQGATAIPERKVGANR